MATRKNMMAKMAEQLAKLESKYPKRSRGPNLYTDQDIINLAQDYARMKTQPAAPPPKPRTKITGKWWEIGTVGKDDVTEHQSERLQYYFDLASSPDSQVNYWVLYFNELSQHGGDWDASDWRKWRIWYFSLHPERRAVYQSNRKSREQARNRRRYQNMTQEQRDHRNAMRRKRNQEKRQRGE